MGRNISLNSFSGYELDCHYVDCLNSNIARVANNLLFLSMVVMFPHELKIQAFLIMYCHWGRCFGWLPTVLPRWLWSTHLCLRACGAGPTPVKAVTRGVSGGDDSFTKGPHLITPKSGHMDTQEERLLCSGSASIRSEPRAVTSQTTLGSPRLSSHVSRISIFSAHTAEISTHLVCQSRPNKPVYVLSTVGTLDIPDRHCHGQVITAITASY